MSGLRAAFLAPAVLAAFAGVSRPANAQCTLPRGPILLSPADGATVGGQSLVLDWDDPPNAARYDVYVDTKTPPTFRVATSIPVSTFLVTNLVPQRTYYWEVVAKTSIACPAPAQAFSAIRTFATGGSCATPGPIAFTSPSNGATGVPPTIALSWSAAANAAGYDVYFGLTASPPLLARNVLDTSLVVRDLALGKSYFWRVVAKNACKPATPGPGDVSSNLTSFTVTSVCPTPAAPTFQETPSGSVLAGQTYALSWRAADGLDRGGAYLVERARNAAFSPVLDRQVTTRLSAVFQAGAPDTLFHRVRAVPACNPAQPGPASATAAVDVVAGPPVVIFTKPPEGVTAGIGQALSSVKTGFTVENLGRTGAVVSLEALSLGSGAFFTIVDPAGGNVSAVTLAPRAPRRFDVVFSNVSTAAPGSYQGVVFATSASTGLPITPFAYVNLAVGNGDEASAPRLLVNGKPASVAPFPGFPASSDDANRPPLSIEVVNPGKAPMALAAEVGPEVWLYPEAGWNATPLSPGEKRTVRLYTKRSRALAGAAFPRYTYFKLRTKAGARARLLVQDNGAAALASGRGAASAADAPAFLVPSIVKGTSQLGNTFVSKVAISNLGGRPVEAELIFSPRDLDGFDESGVKRATLTVPPRDILTLNDPVEQLFGLTPPVSGALEIRAAPEAIGFLSVSSTVEAPAANGGSFGFQMPTLLRGEGARLGAPHTLAGVTAGAAFRSNLILAETTGLDDAVVNVKLYDKTGAARGEIPVTVPKYGQKQLSGVLALLGFPAGLDAARIDLEVTSGSGAVAGLVTVIDNKTDDATTYVGRPVDGTPPAAPAGLVDPAGGASLAGASPAARATPGPLATTFKSVIPSVVNGFPTFKDQPELTYTFQSLLGLTSLTGASATFTLTYRDLQQGGAETRRVVNVPPRGTVEYQNALEELFGVPRGQRSQGPIFVESTTNGLVYCKVFSITDGGTLGDSFPVVPVPSESLTGAGNFVPLALDGLEQSVDPAVGTRSNLILNEVSGQPASVLVRLYEAGNRTEPIAEGRVDLAPFQKIQLSTVFSGLGLDSPDRQADRTNVLCTVTAVEGSLGLVSGVVTKIDNQTGDTTNSLLTPNGGTSGTGGGTIGF